MITRRSFVQQAGLLAATLYIKPAMAIGANRKIGLQLYSLNDVIAKDVRGVIKKVALAGYQEVETYGYNPQALFWGLPAKEFKSLLKSNGLTSPSGHYNITKYLLPAVTETEWKKGMDEYIEAAKALDQQYIVVPSLGIEHRQSASTYSAAAAKLNTIGAYLKNAKLQLAYHNHGYEFAPVDGRPGYDILLNETDPALIKLELDIYWAIHAGRDPEDLFRKHPGRFLMWHVKDMDKAKPALNTEVGEGSIDYHKIFESARLAGVKHIYVEQENYSIDPLESISKSFSYISKNLIK